MHATISEMVDSLSLEEKLQLVHGVSDPDGKATGYVPGLEQFDLPSLRLVDGPLGIRVVDGNATAFPSSIALASTWNPSLADEFGTALGREAIKHDQNIVLAPGVNIIRVPTGGRNFEYYSEDPHLAAQTTVGTIRGIESTGVGATVKHFVANNQDENRFDVSAEVSERALREVYLRAFRAAVKEADVSAVMSAYNRVNGTHMEEHERLLKDILREEWGFEGVVLSDWWGLRDPVRAANAGLDLEMPGIGFEEFFPPAVFESEFQDGEMDLPSLPADPPLYEVPLRAAIESGRVERAVLDEKVGRVLALMRAVSTSEPSGAGAVDETDHASLAARIAVEGTVLLKNDGLLPLGESDALAVIGPNADAPKLGGGGSSEVSPASTVSPVDGLRDRAAAIVFERGHTPIQETSVFDSRDAVDDGDEANVEDAVDAADAIDCAVIVVQDDASEATDRDSMTLPGMQDELIAAVADAAPRTVVVLRTSGPVEMPWLDTVDAVVQSWYPGQEDGNALATVLYGDADAGGRLPVTFGRTAEDYPTADTAAYPGVDDQARYEEGVFVGYRYFHDRDLDPLFPFGHGQSYATFEYDDPIMERDEGVLHTSVTVHNTGDYPGTDVLQAYVEKSVAPVPTPPRELCGFERFSLDPAEETTVSISVPETAFAYYDDGWTLPSGTNRIALCRSARESIDSFDVSL